MSRLQVTASGDRLWRSIFSRPFEELEIADRDAALLRPVYFFEPQPFVARVIFVATPHRGSSLAAGLVGKIGAALVALPRELTRIAKRVIAANRALLTAGARTRQRAPDSIETLSPVDPFLVALDPLAPAVPFHSIIGDRGLGNGSAGSDGVVPYQSAWLPGAASELVVASGHNAHEHPAAIAEIRRILLLHAER